MAIRRAITSAATVEPTMSTGVCQVQCSATARGTATTHSTVSAVSAIQTATVSPVARVIGGRRSPKSSAVGLLCM